MVGKLVRGNKRRRRKKRTEKAPRDETERDERAFNKDEDILESKW